MDIQIRTFFFNTHLECIFAVHYSYLMLNETKTEIILLFFFWLTPHSIFVCDAFLKTVFGYAPFFLVIYPKKKSRQLIYWFYNLNGLDLVVIKCQSANILIVQDLGRLKKKYINFLRLWYLTFDDDIDILDPSPKNRVAELVGFFYRIPIHVDS